MPWIGATHSMGGILRPSIIAVYIGNQYRPDAVVDSVYISSGFRPSSAEISFPESRFPSRPCETGATILVWINPHTSTRPIFKGKVTEFSETHGRPDTVSVQVLDARDELNDDTCQWGYNELDDHTGRAKEDLDSREIIEDIWDQYRDFQSTVNSNSTPLILDKSAFPKIAIGSQPLDGMPHGSAMEVIARMATTGTKRRTYVEYGAGPTSNDYLTSYTIGAGPIIDLRYGTHPLTAVSSQPFGIPNVTGIQYRTRNQWRTTRVTVKGRRRRIQRSFTLTPDWDASIQAAVLLNYPKYAEKQIGGGTVNPSFDPRAVFVGTRYGIPTVNTTDPRTGGTVARQPHILGRLLDAEPDDANKYAPHFCLVTFSGDVAAQVMFDGFTVADNQWVVFSKPLARQSYEAGGVVSMVIPTSVVFVAAYMDEDRLELAADIDDGGTYTRERRNLIVNDDFVWDSYAAGAYQVASGGTITGPLGAAVDDAKHDTELDEWGTARLAEIQGDGVEWAFQLPYQTSQIKLGSQVRINGTTLAGVAVQSIHYTFNPTPQMRITVGSEP